MPAKILVVDDEEDIRQLVEMWLKSAKYGVASAIDGNDCLEKLGKEKPDVILLDIMMPGPTPKEIIEGIRKKAPNARVIYLTAVEWLKETEEQVAGKYTPVIELPVVGYLLKPVMKEKLLEKVKEALKIKSVPKER